MQPTFLWFSVIMLFSAVQGTPSDQKPPSSVGFEGRSPARLMLSNSTVSGVVTYQLSAKTVTVMWNWQAGGPTPNQFSTQVESLTFYPTEVCQAGPSRLAVAGKRRAKTIIELWEFGTPVIPPVVSTPSGISYPEVSVPIATRTVLYEEAVVGRDIASTLFNNPVPPQGTNGALFVQFYDSKDLYALEYTLATSSQSESIAYHCVRKAQSDPSIPVIAELAVERRVGRSAKHPSYGYVYLFTDSAQTATPHPALVLFDANLDGTLDSPGFLVLNDSAWQSGGWADLATYQAVY
ncbi:MAG TPA: hypothetical protein VK843_00880 [Planctomycetota bacterium]|nr:hypothetical protein [Planctomycetota bacterium]